MHMDCVLVLESAIGACSFLQLSSVIEEASSQCLADIAEDIIIDYRKLFIIVVNFYPFTKFNKLIFDVSCSFHGSNLHKVVVTPLAGKLCFFPLIEDI